MNTLTINSMMRTACLMIALALLSVSQARACIGETEAEIVLRYGEGTVVPSDTPSERNARYLFGEYEIVVRFENGISQAELFSKQDAAPLTPPEIELLRNLNAGGHHWMAAPDEGPAEAGRIEWRTVDRRSRIAYYRESDRKLCITTQRFIERHRTRQKSAGQVPRNGFF